MIAVHDDSAPVGGALASASIRASGRWARRESAIIQDLPSDSLVVDVGANVGWHTLVALSLGHKVIGAFAFSNVGCSPSFITLARNFKYLEIIL